MPFQDHRMLQTLDLVRRSHESRGLRCTFAWHALGINFPSTATGSQSATVVTNTPPDWGFLWVANAATGSAGGTFNSSVAPANTLIRFRLSRNQHTFARHVRQAGEAGDGWVPVTNIAGTGQNGGPFLWPWPIMLDRQDTLEAEVFIGTPAATPVIVNWACLGFKVLVTPQGAR